MPPIPHSCWFQQLAQVLLLELYLEQVAGVEGMQSLLWPATTGTSPVVSSLLLIAFFTLSSIFLPKCSKILGSTDSGKTSLCGLFFWFCHFRLENGRHQGCMDADAWILSYS